VYLYGAKQTWIQDLHIQDQDQDQDYKVQRCWDSEVQDQDRDQDL